MKIVMMGSGGVGGYFGARLAAAGADVHFVARGAHLEAMRTQGLTIEGGPAPLHLSRVQATSDPSSIGVADFVLIAVKLWDTADAIEQVRPIVGPNTAVISFQNGVLKDRYLLEAFGPKRVMGGVGYVATTIDRPGVIKQTGPMQRLLFGELDGTISDRGQRLLDACLKGGIAAQLSPDIRREIWQKYVFLVGLSGTTTTIRKPIGPIREHPQTRAFLLDVMREEATEDIYALAGINADDRALGSPLNSVRRRLPWLLLSLGAALIAVAIVQYYVATIESSIWLAVLIPVVATMGSNAATQTMTVVVRGIGLGEVGWETTRRVVTKEALVGLINGVIIGVIVCLTVAVWFGVRLGSMWFGLKLGGILGVTMVLSLVVAGTLGTVVPVLLKRFKVDPALASSMFVVTFTDVITFFFYLGIATLLLSQFKV